MKVIKKCIKCKKEFATPNKEINLCVLCRTGYKEKSK